MERRGGGEKEEELEVDRGPRNERRRRRAKQVPFSTGAMQTDAGLALPISSA